MRPSSRISSSRRSTRPEHSSRPASPPRLGTPRTGRLAKPPRSRAPSGRSPRRLESGFVLTVRVGAVAAPLTRPRPFRPAPCGRSRNAPRARSLKFCAQGSVALEIAREQRPNLVPRVTRLPGRVSGRSAHRLAASRCVRSAPPEPRGHPAGVPLSRSVFAPARTGVQAATADPSICRARAVRDGVVRRACSGLPVEG
jgi:hypothetical protein